MLVAVCGGPCQPDQCECCICRVSTPLDDGIAARINDTAHGGIAYPGGVYQDLPSTQKVKLVALKYAGWRAGLRDAGQSGSSCPSGSTLYPIFASRLGPRVAASVPAYSLYDGSHTIRLAAKM